MNLGDVTLAYLFCQISAVQPLTWVFLDRIITNSARNDVTGLREYGDEIMDYRATNTLI